MAGPAATPEQFWAIASPILDHNGLGCDLLEVGYLFRGIGSLDDHLKLWDLALANGVRLVGTGTSDSHGGVWGPDMVPNPFATWIWARSKGADELLRALKAGRAAFGDPFLWKGKFAFGVDGAMMGDTLFIDGPREARAWVSLGAWRDDLDIRLVTVQIRQGRDVETTRTEWTPAGAGEMPVKLAGPCFLRAEIYARDGSPLVFSNPVFIIPAR
jgi:hypothetical protein